MRPIGLLLGGIALLAGCNEGQVPTDTAHPRAMAVAGEVSVDGAKEDLATLRRVTAPFRSFDNATAAGYSAQITGCMTDPTAGGMGFHYGNVGLIDGAVQVDQPELLLYEPEEHGRLRLVAVEYIIPYTFVSRDSPAPVLFGKPFLQNDTFQLWGLHVWIGKENPSGLFASWNPRVSCVHATGASTMAH